MTNEERLLLEMGNRLYFSQDQYTELLLENGLVSTETFNKNFNMLPLLKTAKQILESLSNNIDYYMTVQTEYTTQSSAYNSLQDRIHRIDNRINELSANGVDDNSPICYLYRN
jgi:hypothetical protein